MLQDLGLPLGELPEEWNLTHAEEIVSVHRAYFAAGCDAVYANTFGANAFKFGDRLEEIVAAGVRNAKRAAAEFSGKYVALDVGSLGKLLKPLGPLGFEEAVSIFKRTMAAGAEAGADFIAIETMNDIYEMKAAVVAAKETCNLPIFASCVFGADGKTMTGTTPEAMVALLEGLGVAALGLNCSLAPSEMLPIAERIIKCSSTPVLVKPNAGLPASVNGKTVYSVESAEFSDDMKKIALAGATCLGGCCGTTPRYMAELIQKTRGVPFRYPKKKELCVISSYTHAEYLGGVPLIIGERINPTGKKRLKQAICEGETGYILNEAITQAERGAHVLDVNVGVPGIDEAAVLTDVVAEIQGVTDLPLQIDTSDPIAMESALRRYNGKALVNSVNGKKESMDVVFPLVKKYGGTVIALTLDEGGIPESAAGRIAIAEKILKEAARYGLGKKDIVFDTLAMAVSADGTAAVTAIQSLQYIRHTMGVNTSLGVSNISFGLPNRDFINGTFFAMALGAGLSAAIINPNSHEMMKTYRSFVALSGKDANCLKYIEYASSVTAVQPAVSVTVGTGGADERQKDLKYYIVKGLKGDAARSADSLLESEKPLDVINGQIIPALDEVGKGFEEKTVFLPQLLMSAEAAAAAFEVIKSRFKGEGNAKKLKIVIATVKGDIHDIGKNIVKTLLENYGFPVRDLGRDVPPERVVEAAKEIGADVVGLSALMTTTVASMAETIRQLRAEYPRAKVVVGGAVMTAEYAENIGADKYCKDAMETVRYCEEQERAK